MKLTQAQLREMAYRGAEDGHGDEWHAQFATGQHTLAAMKAAANAARAALNDSEKPKHDQRAV